MIFTADQVRRLTGLSASQLRYWDRTGFFAPALPSEKPGPFSRVYSFRDLVGLRAIAIMRNKHKVPLQELRKVGAAIGGYEGPWASLAFWLAGKHVFWDHPGTDYREGIRPLGQREIPIAMEMVDQDVRAAVARLRARKGDDIGRIVRNRNVAQNSYVLSGTRIPTSAIWSFHEAGYAPESILKEYPHLNPTDIESAIAWERRKRLKAS